MTNTDALEIALIKSKVTKITNLKRGEFIGYGHNACKAKTTVAQIPLGYADGFVKSLAKDFCIKIKDSKNKTITKYKCCGDICMDCFFVDVANSNIEEGDKVLVFNNAEYFASILKTSCYEVLTNFSRTRAKTIIV